MRALTLAIALALVGMAARPAAADSCQIDASPILDFDKYDVYAAGALDVAGSIMLRCLISLSVTIDLSTGGSGTYASRTMTRTGYADTLSYQLYKDAGRTQIWGNGTGGTVHLGPAIALIAAVPIPVYGRIPAHQDVATGAYADTIVVTLNF